MVGKKNCLYKTSEKSVVMTVQDWPKLSPWALIPRIRASKNIEACVVSRKAESTPRRSASLHIREKTVGISANRGLVVKEILQCSYWVRSW
jgi:hypothetical protein